MSETQQLRIEERLRSVEEASQRWGVSPFTTRRLLKAGHVVGVRVGRRLLISDSEIERVLREGAGPHVANWK